VSRRNPESSIRADDSTRLDDTARAVNSGAIHVLRGMRAVDRESGLTPARLSALSVLVFAGPRTLGRLAEAEGVAGPTMTRIVDGLCDLGLAERRPHPDSARSVQIAATPSGESLMRRAAARRIETLVEAMTRLDPPDLERLVAAAPVLDRLAAAVRDGRPPGQTSTVPPLRQ
jgi:DNA-binding MarR family transcriptional regulator